ncbi:phthiotriol/phenolphthiotriol dimycocerosates methyltransferase [Mycobacterium sp. 1274756.6]|uniref:phthiotriol/phenolphthiotriol dimycocerosates methyltransferase n=1 Tax=Mycobacterium sp. 1274756.6 TaxID=1834076 RepID=UPI0008019183|nr:class I SAM-dependent methyltransferase [Mycobacterium sp. 1274756.6]OBJ70927.1 SAM-dependent methyltransferase [Mycobacterium sp. 1274756.6]
MAVLTTHPKPLQWLALALNRRLTRLNQYLDAKLVYPRLTRRLRDADLVFLNYGYQEDPPMAVPLSDADEPNRLPIQLYHRVATQSDLAGKEVLEVGCGHGGGASYLTRTLKPATYTGLDLNSEGIDYCRQRHSVAGLSFVEGDAERLPFPDQAFDVVINLESSHVYPHFSQFLAEVSRVLRPGGNFLYADFRPDKAVADWEAALANAPLVMTSQQDISEQVTRGLEEALPLWDDVIERFIPRALRAQAHRFNVMRRNYAFMRDGKFRYRMYSFVKEP